MQTPSGTYDLFGSQAAAKQKIIDTARRIFSDAGYQLIETPIFEDTQLFSRGVGDSTDIVNKEMYSFQDPSDRSLTLRPEGTAPVVRSYIQQGMFKLPAPLKVWYYGPFFRYEKPQAGRQRQFNQIGAEVFGSSSIAVEAELMILADLLGQELGVQATLAVNSIGSVASRASYVATLTEFLTANQDLLDDTVRSRIDSNPLRAFDSGNAQVIELMKNAPVLLDNLPLAEQNNFQQICTLLDIAGVKYQYDPSLVRGLDYYTGLVFEFSRMDLGAQSGVSGGGRYDELVQTLGGPQTPAVGFAAGIERLMLAGQQTEAKTISTVIVNEPEATGQALQLSAALLARKLPVVCNLAERGLRGQLKAAMKQNADFIVVASVDAYTLRRRGQEDIAFDNVTELVDTLALLSASLFSQQR